jgi:DNA-binding response OmpR family regulator
MEQHRHSRRTVLLVEADGNLARIIEHALHDRRFVVTKVATGSEALELLRSQHPDSVVLDPALPDGGGAELMEYLRQMDRRGSPLLIWIVVSDLDRAVAIRRYGRPIPIYLVKPFDPWELVQLLEAKFA